MRIQKSRVTGFGIVMLIVSVIAIIWGLATDDFLDGEAVYSGEAPATWNKELVWTSTYYIYVEEGSNVTVELFNENGMNPSGENEFITCQDEGPWDCLNKDTREGFDYVGHVYIIDDDTYNVNFKGEGSVLVIEMDDGAAAITGGGITCCCCCSIPSLILGAYLTKKNEGIAGSKIVVAPSNLHAPPPTPNVPLTQPNKAFGIDYEKATVYRNKWLRDVSVPTDPKKFNEIDVDSLSEGELFSWLALLDIKERDEGRARNALKRKFNRYSTGTMDVYTTNIPINHPYRCSRYPHDDRMAKMHTASIIINENKVFEMFGQPCPEPGCDGFIEPNIPR